MKWTKIIDLPSMPPPNVEVLVNFEGIGTLVVKRRTNTKGESVYTETWSDNRVWPPAQYWTEITDPREP